MKNNVINLMCAIIIALSLVFCALYIGNAINKTSIENGQAQSVLINQTEAADFLGIPEKTFASMLKREKIEKYNVTSYPTYSFIPYINVDGEMYFSREELLKWVQYKSQAN